MPCSYATETYNEVLRWLDNTPIKYAKNPKRKNSKSFDRYARYSQGKTVGEALRLGSYYLDLLFDHEHGHLKATGKPKRKELVSPDKNDWDDSWTQTDKILSTMHRKWIIWQKTFEIADKLGVDRRNLTANKMGGISVEMHANRMEAQVMAKLILEEADKRKKPVTDADMLEVLRLWGFKENTTRQNVMKEGVDWVNSDTLGLLSSYDGQVVVNNTTKHYPAVPKLLCRWLKDHLPKELKDTGFTFTSINVNRGYAAALHRDGNNEGPSMIAAFGEFTGGELNYWPEDDKAKAPLEKLRDVDKATVDLKRNLLLFDGNRGHSVQDFEGERFSIVYFSIGKSHKATAAQRQQLRDAGINFHAEGSLQKMKDLLSPPLGYGDKADKVSAAVAKSRRPLRSWPRTSKASPVKDLLTEKQIHEAKEAAKFVEPPQEEEDAPPETSFVGHQMDRKFDQEGRRIVRVFLKGAASGRLVLAAEGVEERKGLGRYEYRRASGFQFGPELCASKLCEVREWIQKVIKAKGKVEAAPAEDSPEAPAERTPPRGTKRHSGATAAKTPEASEEPPSSKKQRRAPASAASAGKKEAVATKTAAAKAASPAAKGPRLDKRQAIELLCRCTESTAIAYVPGGKTAESHKGSYERYEKYAKATTLKEALEFGAGSADILYDLQAGLLSITGNKRKGPLPSAAKAEEEAEGRFGRLSARWLAALEQM